jgi:hypothetical protein
MMKVKAISMRNGMRPLASTGGGGASASDVTAERRHHSVVTLPTAEELGPFASAMGWSCR